MIPSSIIIDCLNSLNQEVVNGNKGLRRFNTDLFMLVPYYDTVDDSTLTPIKGQTTSPVLSSEKRSVCCLNTIVYDTLGTIALNTKICSISSSDPLSKDLNLTLDEVPTVATGSRFLLLASPLHWCMLLGLPSQSWYPLEICLQ